MRWLGPALFISLLALFGATASGASAKIKKVLPHFLDLKGKHTLSPSLYERDAYQAYLRDHSELRSGLRFDMLFRAAKGAELVLRLELRGSKNNEPSYLEIASDPFKHKGGRSWRSVTLQGLKYEQLGDLLAWRATLWRGDLRLAEQKSFLWQ